MRDLGLLLDILTATQDAVSFVGRKGFPTFASDPVLQSAVAYRILIAGEAATQLSPKTKGENPSHHWKGLTNIRTMLAHRYDIVNASELWEVVHDDFPDLIEFISSNWPNLKAEQ